jgi:hypothetical protein
MQNYSSIYHKLYAFKQDTEDKKKKVILFSPVKGTDRTRGKSGNWSGRLAMWR